MRCGNCKGAHDSVDLVRECFNSSPGKPSPKQISLAQALGREKVRLPEYAEMPQLEYERLIDALDREGMKTFLDRMLKQPDSGMSRAEISARIYNGKYALQNEDDEDVRFYLVSGELHKTLWELTGAPGEFRRQRIYRAEKILRRIAADPMAAFALFGLKVGACGKCGSPLTQKHTRERGIGDTCYAKMTESA